MPPRKRRSASQPVQGGAAFAQLPEDVLPLIAAHLHAPPRKAAALACRALHAAAAPLWHTAAFTLSDSIDAADPKPADARWLMQRLPGLRSLRIMHHYGEGLNDGMGLLEAALEGRPPPFRLRSFSLPSVCLERLAAHEKARGGSLVRHPRTAAPGWPRAAPLPPLPLSGHLAAAVPGPHRSCRCWRVWTARSCRNAGTWMARSGCSPCSRTSPPPARASAGSGAAWRRWRASHACSAWSWRSTRLSWAPMAACSH